MRNLAAPLAVLPCVAWALVTVAAAATSPGSMEGSAWQSALSLAANQTLTLLQAGYERTPLLMVILSALLVLPALALGSLIVRRAGGLAGRAAEAIRVHPETLEQDWTRGPRPGPGVPAWPAQAWLSVEGDNPGSHPVAGELIRIGRHPDNEVWLPDTSVHRYHAVIHRTEDADFFITDLSGEEGNGVRINGNRRSQSPLVDGDVIELGKARLTFASIPI